MNTIHPKDLFLLFACGVLLMVGSGCASDRAISLNYEASTALRANTKQKVTVVKFADKRTDLDLGRAGAKGPRVTTKIDVGSEIGQALYLELGRAALDAERAREMPESNSEIVVTGEVLQTKADVGPFSVEGLIRTTMSVKKAGTTLLAKEFTGKGKTFNSIGAGPTGMFGYSADVDRVFKSVFERALQDLMKQAVPEILRVVPSH
jgi:hypothetical protein